MAARIPARGRTGDLANGPCFTMSCPASDGVIKARGRPPPSSDGVGAVVVVVK